MILYITNNYKCVDSVIKNLLTSDSTPLKGITKGLGFTGAVVTSYQQLIDGSSVEETLCWRSSGYSCCTCCSCCRIGWESYTANELAVECTDLMCVKNPLTTFLKKYRNKMQSLYTLFLWKIITLVFKVYIFFVLFQKIKSVPITSKTFVEFKEKKCANQRHIVTISTIKNLLKLQVTVSGFLTHI